MKKCFVNFTNHPKERWENSQIIAAEKYGEIIDLPFPSVRPEMDKDTIDQMATEYVNLIKEQDPDAVLCQGEFTLCFAVVEKLKESGIPVMAACSERIVEEQGDRKISEFHFSQMT